MCSRKARSAALKSGVVLRSLAAESLAPPSCAVATALARPTSSVGTSRRIDCRRMGPSLHSVRARTVRRIRGILRYLVRARADVLQYVQPCVIVADVDQAVVDVRA